MVTRKPGSGENAYTWEEGQLAAYFSGKGLPAGKYEISLLYQTAMKSDGSFRKADNIGIGAIDYVNMVYSVLDNGQGLARVGTGFERQPRTQLNMSSIFADQGDRYSGPVKLPITVTIRHGGGDVDYLLMKHIPSITLRDATYAWIIGSIQIKSVKLLYDGEAIPVPMEK